MTRPSRYDAMLPLTDAQLRSVHFEEDDPAAVWRSLTPGDVQDFKTLCRAMKPLVFRSGIGRAVDGLARLLYRTAYRPHGHFTEESDWFADASGGVLTRAQAAMVQRMYTLAHIAPALGCTTCCVWDARRGSMLCFRSLDWRGGLELAQATRLYDFVDESENTRFRAAGVVGMVGVLTAVRPGFGVVINYLPWRFPSAAFRTDPLFELRRIMQDPTVRTYDDAKARLADVRVGAPVCFTLCGTDRGQACAVEVGSGSRTWIREMGGSDFLVQTNHYDATGRFRDKNIPMPDFPAGIFGRRVEHWHDSGLMQNSDRRRRRLEAAVREILDEGRDLETGLVAAYGESPVWNHETAHWAALRPADASLRIWRRTPLGGRRPDS